MSVYFKLPQPIAVLYWPYTDPYRHLSVRRGFLTPNHTNLIEWFLSFSWSNKTAYKDEHFKFVYEHLLTELAENRQVCSKIPPLKKGVRLCLISLSFQSYGLFSRKKRPHWKYQSLGACRKKPNHIWKIADTFFEGDVWENISDVNRATQIIQAWKQTSLSEAVFLDSLLISLRQ